MLGSPIAHSLSPALHRAAYAAAGLHSWTYDAIEVTEPDLVSFVEERDASWRGLSLTMPLKQAAFAVAEAVSPEAQQARAINTLLRRDNGGWEGHNTDIEGMVAALAGAEHRGSALILGAGATARSAVLALRRLGVQRIDIAARRREAARELVCLVDAVGARGEARDLSEWSAAAPALVVSTVPAAAGADLVATVPRSETLDLTLLDVVYAPWPTPLATLVASSGGRVVSGLEMLIHQAARQVELFTGRTADLEAMRAAVQGRV